MKKIAVCIIAHVILSPIVSSAAPIIERMPGLQPVRIAYARVTPAYRGKTVTWKIAAYTIDEASLQYTASPDTVIGAGDSVQVRLLKDTGKYSYYKIFASAGTERDSMELQVFGKASMQKFLFRSSWFPTKPIAVYFYLPSTFSPSTQQVVVMHGIDRNAFSYGTAWTGYASLNGWMVIAPEFTAADWTSDAYGLGNMFTGSDGAGSLNPRAKWTFSIVSEIQRTLSRGFGLTDSLYTLWGHSAGGQFVHRMMLFAYDPNVRRAIPANSGWYTAPDSTIAYPWGVKHPMLSISRQDLLDFASRDLVIMRGTADTLRDSNLNIEPLSDAQGPNRYQRAGYFFKRGFDASSQCRWQLLDVVGSGHDNTKMTAGAAKYLQGLTLVPNEAAPNTAIRQMGSYPNPFNASANIVFTLTEASRTSVAVYNILGEKIQTLVDDDLLPGVYRKQFDGTAHASGIYFCRIHSHERSSVIKLLLLK